MIERKNAGDKVLISHVYGVRGSSEFGTGATTIFARDFNLEIIPKEPVAAPAEVMAQA